MMDSLNLQVIFLLHLVATSAMFGVIWLVQLVHYPMLIGLNQIEFHSWHEFHARRISFIVAPLMLFELGASVLGVLGAGAGDARIASVILASLTLGVWASTFAVSVPLHDQLSKNGYNPKVLSRLVHTNWIRTLLYTCKLILMIGMMIAMMFGAMPFGHVLK